MNKIRQLINNKLPDGSFIRNVVTLMTGTTFAQALLILIAPILTRLYSPDDFGIFALYTSILGILAVVACFRYELAIVLPEKDEDAANVLALSILITLGLSFIILLLVAVFKNSFSNLLGAPELSFWLWFMPFSLLVAGLFQIFNYWSTRKKQFRRLAVRQITQSSVTAVTQLSAGAITSGAGGLIGGHIAGQAVATGRLAGQIWKDEGKQILSYLSKEKIKKVLLRYKDFPLFSSWAIFLNSISAALPALLLAYFFNPIIVGYYALGHRVLAMPLGVIGGAVAQVFFPRATEAYNKGELDSLTISIFGELVSIGLVPLLLLMLVAPDLFVIVFGDSWLVAGEYVRWLSLWLFLQFISSPISMIYMILERQREFLRFNFILFIIRFLSLMVGGILESPLLAIALYGITGALLYSVFCFNILNMAKVDIVKAGLIILRQAIYSIPFLIIPILMYNAFNNSLIFVISAVIMGGVFLFYKGGKL